MTSRRRRAPSPMLFPSMTLSDAAYAAHPLFEQRGDFIRWLGDPKDEPSHNAVVEWFQLNHPAKAREIERLHARRRFAVRRTISVVNQKDSV